MKKTTTKIPTAEEFVANYKKQKYAKNEAPEFIENMIEFARLHVQAALEKASKEVKLEYMTLSNDMGYSYMINKNSILNAYPINNIK